jgi:putative transposase
VRYRLIDAEKTHHGVSLLARVLGVSRQGYYAWKARGRSRRARQDQALTETIVKIHARSRYTYGAPRIHAELRDDFGVRVGRKRVARLMRTARLEGVHRRRRRGLTRRDPGVVPPHDLVNRDFTAPAPNRVWTADITYVPTGEGWLYLAVVLDVFSRRIVGWAMAGHLHTELVIDALEMAVWNRRPEPGLIHHSDQGTQYTSLSFSRRCRSASIRTSTGSVADCYDNAVTESFLPRWRPSCSTGTTSPPVPRPRRPASTSSKGSTTPAATRAWACSAPPTTRGMANIPATLPSNHKPRRVYRTGATSVPGSAAALETRL